MGSEETLVSALNKLAASGARNGLPVGFPWTVLIDIIISLFKNCGKDAIKNRPVLSRIRLTREIRKAMPAASLWEIGAVREAAMQAALEATDEELAAFGAINLEG